MTRKEMLKRRKKMDPVRLYKPPEHLTVSVRIPQSNRNNEWIEHQKRITQLGMRAAFGSNGDYYVRLMHSRPQAVHRQSREFYSEQEMSPILLKKVR